MAGFYPVGWVELPERNASGKNQRDHHLTGETQQLKMLGFGKTLFVTASRFDWCAV